MIQQFTFSTGTQQQFDSFWAHVQKEHLCPKNWFALSFKHSQINVITLSTSLYSLDDLNEVLFKFKFPTEATEITDYSNHFSCVAPCEWSATKLRGALKEYFPDLLFDADQIVVSGRRVMAVEFVLPNASVESISELVYAWNLDPLILDSLQNCPFSSREPQTLTVTVPILPS